MTSDGLFRLVDFGCSRLEVTITNAEAPEGVQANWTQTVPGKGWFVLLRLYGPLDPWWEKTWQPGEFERID